MSTILKTLLKDLLSKVEFMSPNIFPVLKGCDDYVTRLQNVTLDMEDVMKTKIKDFEAGEIKW